MIAKLLTLFGLIDWTRLFVPLSTRNHATIVEKKLSGKRVSTIGWTGIYVWIFRIVRIQRTSPWD